MLMSMSMSMAFGETKRELPQQGQLWCNKRTRRVCKIVWITTTVREGGGQVHYRYEEVAPVFNFVQAPSSQLDSFLAKFERVP